VREVPILQLAAIHLLGGKQVTTIPRVKETPFLAQVNETMINEKKEKKMGVSAVRLFMIRPAKS